MAKSGQVQIVSAVSQNFAASIFPSSDLVTGLGGVLSAIQSQSPDPLSALVVFGDVRKVLVFPVVTGDVAGGVSNNQLSDLLGVTGASPVASEIYEADPSTTTLSKVFAVQGITSGSGYTGTPVFAALADRVLSGSKPSLTLSAFLAKVEDSGALRRASGIAETMVAFVDQRSNNVIVGSYPDAQAAVLECVDYLGDPVTPLAVYAVPSTGGSTASAPDYWESGASL